MKRWIEKEDSDFEASDPLCGLNSNSLVFKQWVVAMGVKVEQIAVQTITECGCHLEIKGYICLKVYEGVCTGLDSSR